MGTTTEFKVGQRIELDGEPYVVVESTSQSPSARGGMTLIKTRLRHLRTKQLLGRTFRAGDRVKVPDFELRACQFLYADGDGVHYFMDQETFDQHGLPRENIEDELGFIRPNDIVRAMFFDGECIGIEIAPTVTLEVTACELAVRGDTATAVTKAATLETGLVVQVPLFINVGDHLVIDTRENRYVRRA